MFKMFFASVELQVEVEVPRVQEFKMIWIPDAVDGTGKNILDL